MSGCRNQLQELAVELTEPDDTDELIVDALWDEDGAL